MASLDSSILTCLEKMQLVLLSFSVSELFCYITIPATEILKFWVDLFKDDVSGDMIACCSQTEIVL
jgi:hypothetical protein